MIQQTSLECYQGLKSSGVLSEMEYIVYIGLKRFSPCTDRELAVFLHYDDPNKVRPRRNKLVERGLVKELGKRKCNITGKNAIIWGIEQNGK